MKNQPRVQLLKMTVKTQTASLAAMRRMLCLQRKLMLKKVKAQMAKIMGMGMVKLRRMMMTMMMMRRWEMKILIWILRGKCWTIARAIVEKSPGNTLEKAKIYSVLEDINNSLSDYMKALAMLEQLVEPDHRRIVELNFRICLVYELASKIGDAIPYCAKAFTMQVTHRESKKFQGCFFGL
ncbi:unnamed protein product [Urochloa humidicola]